MSVVPPAVGAAGAESGCGGGARVARCGGGLDLGRLVDHALRRRLERVDLSDLQALLPAQRRDEADALGTRGCQCDSSLRARPRRPHRAPGASRRASRAASQARLRICGDRDDLAALIGDAVQVVESRHRVVERLRAEHHRERTDVTLLVEHRQVVAEPLLRDGERAACRAELLQELRLLHCGVESSGARATTGAFAPPASVNRAHTDRAVRGARANRAIAPAGGANRPGRAAAGGRDDGEYERRSGTREPRRGSCPWPAHEGGTVPQKTLDFADFVRSRTA